MSETVSFNLRVASELRDHVAKIAQASEGDDRSTDMSTVARKLIYIGLGVRKSGGEPEVAGKFGLAFRPFSRVQFEGDRVTFGTQLEEDVANDLEAWFDTSRHGAAREALRLGVIALQHDDLQIKGPFGMPRPFAEVDLSEQITDERALEALAELQKHV
jgi:hypothetical protein